MGVLLAIMTHKTKGVCSSFGQHLTDITNKLNSRSAISTLYSNDQFGWRIRSLRSSYSEFTQLPSNPKSTGMSWDANTNTVVCDEHQWKRFKADKTIEKFRKY